LGGQRRAFAQALRQRKPQRAPCIRTHGHEAVERRRGAHRDRPGRESGEGAGIARGMKVDNLVADRHADAERLARVAPAKRAERQVLDRKVRRRIVGGIHPARERHVVRFVQGEHAEGFSVHGDGVGRLAIVPVSISSIVQVATARSRAGDYSLRKIVRRASAARLERA